MSVCKFRERNIAACAVLALLSLATMFLYGIICDTMLQVHFLSLGVTILSLWVSTHGLSCDEIRTTSRCIAQGLLQ
jgi:hypothetical protein